MYESLFSDLIPELPDGASAPSWTNFQLPTYDQCCPVDDYIPPPPLPPPTFDQSMADASGWKISSGLTNEEALEALAEHIAKNCCWGTGPMKKMEIQSIEPSTAYKYLMTRFINLTNQ